MEEVVVSAKKVAAKASSSAVKSAASMTGKALAQGATVAVGDNARIAPPQMPVASNQDRARYSVLVHDQLNPSNPVIGGSFQFGARDQLVGNSNTGFFWAWRTQAVQEDNAFWMMLMPMPKFAGGFGAIVKGSGAATRTGSQLLLKPAVPALTQEGLEHIVARHWFSSGAKGAGKFLEGTTARRLKDMINTTATQGVFRANTRGRAGTIAEFNFGRVIGTTSRGTSAFNLRVVIGANGNVITAFPF